MQKSQTAKFQIAYYKEKRAREKLEGDKLDKEFQKKYYPAENNENQEDIQV